MKTADFHTSGRKWEEVTYSFDPEANDISIPFGPDGWKPWGIGHSPKLQQFVMTDVDWLLGVIPVLRNGSAASISKTKYDTLNRFLPP